MLDTELDQLFLQWDSAMTIHQYSRVIAVLPSLDAIGQAVDHLVLSGFPLSQLFLVGQDNRGFPPKNKTCVEILPVKELLHEAAIETVTNSTTNLRRGLMVGNVTGGLTGLLVGVGLLAVPGVGELFLAYVAAYLFSSLGLGTLTGCAVGALVGQGISHRTAKDYAAQALQGNYLLIVNGSESEVFRAEHLLYLQDIQSKR